MDLPPVDLQARAVETDDRALRAKASVLCDHHQGYKAHAEYLSGTLPLRQMLAQMFESDELVQRALQIIWGNRRFFETTCVAMTAGASPLKMTANSVKFKGFSEGSLVEVWARPLVCRR